MMENKTGILGGHLMCPFCGGNVEFAGLSGGHIFPDVNTGQMYVCKECNYKGSFIIEVDSLDEFNKMKEALKANETNIDDSAFSYPDKWRWIWKILLILIIAGITLQVIIVIFGLIMT